MRLLRKRRKISKKRKKMTSQMTGCHPNAAKLAKVNPNDKVPCAAAFETEHGDMLMNLV
jgi:hypothetical protein